MRKLKAWEIVLLVIFYPVGICVLIYRLVKKSKLKREREEAELAAAEERERKAAADRERREREEARRASLDRRIYRVVGVTYDNDDGPARNRQTILREIAAEEPHPRAFSLEVYDFEGEPAVLPLMDRYAGLSDFAITGGGDKYGLEIAVYFKKAA